MLSHPRQVVRLCAGRRRKPLSITLLSGLILTATAACSGGSSESAATPVASAPPAASPSLAAAGSPVVGVSPTPSASSTTVWVGNTDGEGVFLRGSPNLSDHLGAYPDGTPLKVTGPQVQGDNTQWLPVQAPDGTTGYVPVEYTVTVAPTPVP